MFGMAGAWAQPVAAVANVNSTHPNGRRQLAVDMALSRAAPTSRRAGV
jgi:hypothetical protein